MHDTTGVNLVIPEKTYISQEVIGALLHNLGIYLFSESTFRFTILDNLVIVGGVELQTLAIRGQCSYH